MTKIKSRDELTALREKYRDHVIMRLVSDEPESRTEVLVAMAECGTRAGARNILKTMFEEVNVARLEHVSVIAVDCMGNCPEEPTVEIVVPGQKNVRYKKVTPQLAKQIVNEHLAGGKVVESAVLEVLK